MPMNYEMYPQLFVDGLQRKDPVVHDWLVRKYRVWSIVEARRQGAKAESEDIAHDALMAVLEKPPIAAIERGIPMRAILCVKIYDRICISLLKQGRFAPMVHSFPQSGPGLQTALHHYDKYQKVRRALDKLATQDRELIEERYLGGKRAVEMADEQTRSPAAVRGGVFRAMERLRRVVQLAS
ncbi:hypothetical protein PPSIR1_39135 [Plesiocystis pacifica SIR-1]|uniref:Uncharacterized protein n=2 Tax=Plesiocystis pacifica TaxID=191768 RepID=A6GJ00_9BACT|nr:hypothetical protein PPSIR1_39135 [Plesiocystis pacifica SIR-1]